MLAIDDSEIRDRRVNVTATDINPDILEEARRGVYETSQTTDIESELEPLDDYSAYIDQHDLIRGESKRDFDLVLCRNFLIYIDAEYKTPIFETIRESLRDDGYLMIGMTETLPAECRDAFEPVHKQRRIYRRS